MLHPVYVRRRIGALLIGVATVVLCVVLVDLVTPNPIGSAGQQQELVFALPAASNPQAYPDTSAVAVPEPDAVQVSPQEVIAKAPKAAVKPVHPKSVAVPHILVQASRVKSTTPFPKTADLNANDRRTEWLNSNRAVLPGTPRATAVQMLASHGWNLTQWGCLDRLWWHESGWHALAHNDAGAYGIAQALPGHKMSSAGKDWKTNPTTQIRWGLDYIDQRYGSPCKAFTFWSNKAATEGQGWY
jgi:hypothetical protein